MMHYTKEQLEQAHRSIESTLHKCEKALENLKAGTSQWTLTQRRIEAFRLSLALIERELGCLGEEDASGDFLGNLDQLHTTQLGWLRVKKNLNLAADDVLAWCKEKARSAQKIHRRGKNLYVHTEGVIITINARSYTIITAHRKKEGSKDENDS